MGPYTAQVPANNLDEAENAGWYGISRLLQVLPQLVTAAAAW